MAVPLCTAGGEGDHVVRRAGAFLVPARAAAAEARAKVGFSVSKYFNEKLDVTKSSKEKSLEDTFNMSSTLKEQSTV